MGLERWVQGVPWGQGTGGWIESVETTVIARPGEEASRDSLRQLLTGADWRHWRQVVWVGAEQNCAKAEKDGAILLIRCVRRWLSDSQ